MKCTICRGLAEVALPGHNAGFCREHYRVFYLRQVARTIKRYGLVDPDDRILVAVSGGKDSLGLALALKELGHAPTALNVDLGITASSHKARLACAAFCEQFDIPLHVVQASAHGLAIPDVVQCISRPVCSACGSIKRYLFNQYALENEYTVLATGHNLDDEVGRLFANVINWRTDYLSDQGPLLDTAYGFVRKVKPLCLMTEYESAAYSFLQGIHAETSPCPYSQGATFTLYKQLMQQLERSQPGRKRYFYEGFLKRGNPLFARQEQETGRLVSPCIECGYPTSSEVCSICRLKKSVQERTSGSA